jgi:hypothetical protein
MQNAAFMELPYISPYVIARTAMDRINARIRSATDVALYQRPGFDTALKHDLGFRCSGSLGGGEVRAGRIGFGPAIVQRYPPGAITHLLLMGATSVSRWVFHEE